jgi:nucleoside-diphosphate-sugar epimerase
MVAALIALSKKGKAGEVYNAGNPNEHTIFSLAEEIKEVCNSSSIIVHEGLPEDDPIKRRPDIEKIRKETGWEPKIKFRDGISKTVEWFRGEIK